MQTLTTDDQKRVRLPDAEPGQVFAYDAQADGSLMLTPVKKTDVRRVQAKLTRKDGRLFFEIPKNLELAEEAIPLDGAQVKSYWDTSAVINAAISAEVMDRLKSGEHVTRLHTLAEFFAHMTGRGIKYRDRTSGEEVFLFFTPDECSAWLRDFAGRIQFEDLSRDEVLAGLDRAQKLNVQGAKIYDYWHALAAGKAGADDLLTRNTDDFRGLAQNVHWP